MAKYPKWSYLYELEQLEKKKQQVKKEASKLAKYMMQRHGVLLVFMAIVVVIYVLVAIYLTITHYVI